jgi:transcriptional regulator with XRE-family HTH domain
MTLTHRFNGNKLHQFRKDHGWSLEELSNRSQLSVSHLSALETGARKSPSIDLIYQLAEALSISIYQLLDADTSSTLSDTQYPEMSAFTATKDDNVAEEIVSWGRKLHPGRIAFILNSEAEEYLTLAQRLHENRHSPTIVLQIFTDFIQKLNSTNSTPDLRQ